MLLIAPVTARSGSVAADTASAPSLTISQLKITSSNGQFITLYNSTNTTLDMSRYQLEYFNNYDLGKATSRRLIALSGSLPPHGYYMVNDSSLLLCYQLTVNSISLGLSSTAGLVEVLAFNQTSPGGSVTPVLQDYVGWSKTITAGAQTLPSNTNAFLQRQPLDVHNNPAINAPGAGSWQTVQPDATNACNLVAGSGTPSIVPTGLSLLLPATEPPAIMLALSDDTSTTVATAVLPAADIGLMAPQLTELLPNPDGTGNDASDEYIELYNPNGSVFDLTGFGLQSGITSLHRYTFPTGTSLPPHGFVVYSSATTGLSLSNTSGQVALLDPFGNRLSVSEVYASAKDGQTWSLANGKWYWTTTPTPGAANVIKQPPSTKKTSATSAKAAAGKTAAGKTKTAKAGTAAKPSAFTAANTDSASLVPIHSGVLALVVGLALLYGAYEYRTDLANRVFQLRRYLDTRRAGRQ